MLTANTGGVIASGTVHISAVAVVVEFVLALAAIYLKLPLNSN